MRKKREVTPFGMEVKLMLMKKNLTSRDLAKLVGLSEATICDVVFGRNKGKRTIKRIAEALEIDSDDKEWMYPNE